MDLTLNPSKMETNELPEGKFSIEHDDKVNVLEEYFWRIYSPPVIGDGAITEMCIAKVYDESAAIHIVNLLNQDRLALQSKEEELSELENCRVAEEEVARLNDELKSITLIEIPHHMTTIKQLSEQLKAKEGEIKLLKEGHAMKDKAFSDEVAYAVSLTKENERLRGLVEKCRGYVYVFEPQTQSASENQSALLAQIDLLSQSTDKP